jgi:anti-sigma-K factor RskA
MTGPPRKGDDGWTIEAGAYVLGALDEQETAAFESHFESCERCREEVDYLRAAVEMLPATVREIDPSRAVRDRIMSVVYEEEALLRRAAGRPPSAARQSAGPWWRRTPRLRVMAPALAGAAALIGAGVLAGSLVQDSGPGARTLAASVDRSAAPSATAKLVRVGDQAELHVTGMPPAPGGHIYQVWVRGRGAPQPTDALFDVNRDGQASVAVPGDLSSQREVLVTDEPPGGSLTPSGAPVIRVRVA